MATHQMEITDRPGVIAESRGGAGLRTHEILGKWPWIGLILFLIGGLAFGAFTYNVYTNGPLLQLDKPLSMALPAYGLQHASLWKPISNAGFLIGGWVLTILALFTLMYFSSWHYWEEFFMLLVGMVGESILFEVINMTVGRPRPPTQIWNILKIPGFPSGHTEASVVFFGFMAYLLVPKVRSIAGKVLIILFAIFLMVFVGFTRVFSAGHYLSDVLAGFSLGLAWAALAYTSVELYFRKRRSRNGQKG